MIDDQIMTIMRTTKTIRYMDGIYQNDLVVEAFKITHLDILFLVYSSHEKFNVTKLY